LEGELIEGFPFFVFAAGFDFFGEEKGGCGG
jgi:hypothetical protein